MDNNNALATVTAGGELAQLGTMSVKTIVARKRQIAEVMDAVMKDGEHYGKIPGCGDKPSLFKAGAEVLATTFGLAPTFKISRTDLGGAGHREYEIVCTLHHIATGAVVGEGVGCCSTMESKYRYRRGERACPHCKKSTIIKGKDEYGGGWLCYAKRGGCGAKWADGAKEIEAQETGRVENPDLADTYNTVLKMAKKRAQVDCTLTAVGASDLLTQDLEDLPPSDQPTSPAKPEPAKTSPSKKPAKASPPTEAQALTDDELEDLVEQISKCGTATAVKSLSDRYKERTALLDDAARERLTRIAKQQLAQIRAAEAAERAAAKAS